MPSAPALFTTLCFAVALFFAAPAQAFETDLKAPEGGTFAPTGPLEVYIPADVTDDQLARLHLVIDGVDQRNRIEVRGEYARLVPVEPLAPGVHQLDLVELTPDGTVITHGSWEFTVAGDASLSGSTVRYAGGAAFTSDNSVTLVSKDNSADRFTSNGSVDLQGRAESDRWQAGARLPFVYDTAGGTLSGKAFDIADYLLDAQLGAASANLGHHNIESHNVLLENGLARRGVSGQLELERMRSRVSAFAMQSSVTSGFDNLLGLSDRDDRVWGVTGQTSPIDTAAFGMDVSFSYLDGRDPQLGPATGSLFSRRQAETWGVSTTLKFLDNTLSLRGDFAHSLFDIPEDPMLDAENGEAYKLGLAWSPAAAVTMFGDDAQFSLGADYHRYGTFFTNPGNPGDIRDQERYAAIAQLAASEWSWSVNYAQLYDNVDDNPLLPRARQRGTGTEFTYTPAPAQDAEGNIAYGWLGNPTYGLLVSYSDAETVEAPRLGAPGDPTDFANGQVEGRLDFDKGTWTWGVSYAAILEDDRTANERGLTHNAGAQASINFSQIGMSLTPAVQYTRTNLDGRRADDTAVVGNLIALYSPTDIPVSAGLSFNFSRNATSDGTLDTNAYVTSANVGWTALDGAGLWPSLELSLNGTYQITDDRTGLTGSSDTYVALLKASLGWSRNFGTQ